jgi:rhodanese-related sulfurtransferase
MTADLTMLRALGMLRPSGFIDLCVLLTLLAGTCGCAGARDEFAAYRQNVREKYPTVLQISTAELAGWLSDSNRVPPLLLDVREEVEFRVSHLKDARLVRQEDDARVVVGGIPAQSPIVVYCSVGVRASDFALELQRAGYTNVFNLDGAIFQWANEGRAIYSGSNVVTCVHPYNRKWGRFLKKELHADVQPSSEAGCVRDRSETSPRQPS